MMLKFWRFMTQRNVLDWTIGIVIGTAFSKSISSFVSDIVLPPIGLLLGKVDFRDLYINLSRTHYKNFMEAKNAGAPTINYGLFIGTLFDFLIVSFLVFLVMEQLQKVNQELADEEKVVKQKPALDSPPFKQCPYCLSRVPREATRCRFCTSHLPH